MMNSVPETPEEMKLVKTSKNDKRIRFPGKRKSLGPAERPFADYKQKDTSSKEELEEAKTAATEKVTYL